MILVDILVLLVFIYFSISFYSWLCVLYFLIFWNPFWKPYLYRKKLSKIIIIITIIIIIIMRQRFANAAS